MPCHNPLVYFNLPSTFFTSFLASQFTALPYPKQDFRGQTIIVTGANTGLGLEAARHFVRLGAEKVILGCRSLEKGEAAKIDIEATTDTRGVGIVEVWQVSLNSYASVGEFCARVNKLERLDVLVENAGIATPHFEIVEGTQMESTIVVNVISTFLMALLILPKLRESAFKFNMVPRLTIVASDAHELARFREQQSALIFGELQKGKYQNDRYNVSKLLEILIIRELAPAMTASRKAEVILNTLTPGFCQSDLLRHAMFPLDILAWLGKRLIARSAEVGSRTLVHAAGSGDETHGKYLVDCKVGDVSSKIRCEKGDEVQKRVYGELLKVLEGIHRGISENI